MNILFKNVIYYCDGKIQQAKAIWILNNTIKKIYTVLPEDLSQFNEVFDCTDLFVIPGLVNAHYHSGSNSTQSLSKEMSIFDWGNSSTQGQIQNKIFAMVDQNLEDEEYQVLIEKGFAELLDQGVTTIFDSGFAFRSPQLIVDIFKSLGLRGVIDTYKDYPQFQVQRDACINFAAHLPEEEDLSEETLSDAETIKIQYQPKFFSHSMENLHRQKLVSEKYGKSSVQLFNEKKLLDHKCLLFHGTKWQESDVEIAKQTNLTIVHCPESNLQSGAGIAPIASCLRAKVNVAIGTDWARTSMWDNLRLSYSLLKLTSESQEFSAEDIFDCATINGATFFSEKLGAIKEGFLADLTFIQISNEKFLPLIQTEGFTNICHNVLLQCNKSDIHSVMIDGKWVKRDYQLLTVDEKVLTEKYRRVMEKMYADKNEELG